MHRTASSSTIVFFLIISLSLLGTIAQARSQSLTVLTSQHKFSLSKQTEVGAQGQGPVAQSEDFALVIISQGECLAKRRPADFATQVVAPSVFAEQLSARSAIVLDAVTGQAIFGKLPDRPAQPASTIKILTGLISLDSLQANEPVLVSKRAARMPRSKVYLRSGKAYPANDLINAVLLASANDASVALGEKIAGSEKMFAKLMTAKAESLGATNTVCRTASGLTSRGQYSTARDLAVIFNKAMDHSQFAHKMSRIKVKTRDGKVLRSHNRALWQVDGAQGGKTGYTSLAGKTYVGKFIRDNAEIVVAFLGSEKMWEDVTQLVEYGFKKKAQNDNLLAAARPVADSANLVKLVSLDRSSSQKEVPTILSGLSKTRSL
jgi:D-alanyl-D-alanine carboxypeptidase (penicillin-binding protein 5/6)